ncbi:MAG: SMP-30/gluconolactonase/LRE family protein, partial [Labilithrix sp.]|nr:SMP-30/gluconolactonase/LRE family protein [Labilithrix sp.]
KNDSKDGNRNPGDPADPGADPGPGTPGDPNVPSEEERNTNPVEGLEPAAAILETGAYTDGPVWHAGMAALYFSTPLGEGALFRMLPDGRVMKLRDGVSAQGTQPIGNTVNAAGELVTVEAKRVVRQAVEGGDSIPIALNYSGAPAPTPDPDASAPQTGDGQFDTLNDVVARKDGTLYVTDPGYFSQTTVNRIYRIDPAQNIEVVEAFEDTPRPNGIALSPDEKMLYVGFSAPVAGTLPFIRKYTVNEDGTLGEWTKFVEIGPEDSAPDGLAVDKVGNVYVATKAGVEVFKPDGAPWGTIAVPEPPTGLSFGGEDLKTLYITTAGVKIWHMKTKLAGIAQ